MQGPHVDELFGAAREARLKKTEHLLERGSQVTGKRPLHKFDMAHVTWRDYYPSPNAYVYDQELVLSACQYSIRYAYKFGAQVSESLIAA